MLTRLTLVPLLVLVLAGCSKNTLVEPTPIPDAPVLRTAPDHGATAVRLDAVVTLDFGVAVEPDVAEGAFRLLSEVDMTGSCPVPDMSAHGSMDAIMADSTKLSHMDAYHATPGRFEWNEARTMCTFRPDSLMRPQTRYMLHLGRPMLEMLEGRGGSMGGGPMMASGDMTSHFTTTTADDHNGHH